VSAKTFLEDGYNRYIKLVQNSNLLKHKVDDKLTGYKLIELVDTIPNATLERTGDETPSSTNDSV